MEQVTIEFNGKKAVTNATKAATGYKTAAAQVQAAIVTAAWHAFTHGSHHVGHALHIGLPAGAAKKAAEWMSRHTPLSLGDSGIHIQKGAVTRKLKDVGIDIGAMDTQKAFTQGGEHYKALLDYLNSLPLWNEPPAKAQGEKDSKGFAAMLDSFVNKAIKAAKANNATPELVAQAAALASLANDIRNGVDRAAIIRAAMMEATAADAPSVGRGRKRPSKVEKGIQQDVAAAAIIADINHTAEVRAA